MARSEKTTGPQDDMVLSNPPKLADLLGRSQSQFELEFYVGIAERFPAYTEVLSQLAYLMTSAGRHVEALDLDRRLNLLRPRDPGVTYNLACSYALLGQIDEAIATLRSAIQFGFWDVDHILIDPDLSNLHNTPEFARLLADLDLEEDPN